MSQKVAFITGGNRGLGFQTAIELKDAGVKVVIGSRNLAQGEQAVAKLRAAGVDADVLEFDITKASDAQAAYDYFNSRYGRLDILVNNAGIAAGVFPGTGPEHSATQVSADLLHKVFETNFFAQVALTNALLPLIRKSEAGRIVNLSSILGSLALHADPKSPIYHAKSFAYDASKTALNAYTVHLAYELRDTRIKVNSAHPGWVKTDMGGDQAPMELSEGAKTSAALATLPDDGPSGGYFHLGKPLPW
ncbi:MAG: SDR family oxidoreductase [Terracidiphilus sp.]|jgi:NAD(P)-dependent dehydrogenase (short-subunit alcohol dehydrogenase family)